MANFVDIAYNSCTYNLADNKKKEKGINKKFIIFYFVSIFLILFSLPLILAEQTKGTFTIQAPNTCQDGVIGGNEECDLADLADETCSSRGYDTGTLTCTEDCMFNESGCYNNPSAGGGGGGGGAPIIKECNDKKDNDDDGKCDYNGCIINNTKLEADPGCTNIYDDSEAEAACYTLWVCDPWGECIPDTSLQKRICIDSNYCKEPFQKTESQSCFVYVEPKKCIFLFIPCWLWILIIFILIASAIYYYYKKKKEQKTQKINLLKNKHQKTSKKNQKNLLHYKN